MTQREDLYVERDNGTYARVTPTTVDAVTQYGLTALGMYMYVISGPDGRSEIDIAERTHADDHKDVRVALSDLIDAGLIEANDVIPGPGLIYRATNVEVIA